MCVFVSVRCTIVALMVDSRLTKKKRNDAYVANDVDKSENLQHKKLIWKATRENAKNIIFDSLVAFFCIRRYF